MVVVFGPVGGETERVHVVAQLVRFVPVVQLLDGRQEHHRFPMKTHLWLSRERQERGGPTGVVGVHRDLRYAEDAIRYVHEVVGQRGGVLHVVVDGFRLVRRWQPPERVPLRVRGLVVVGLHRGRDPCRHEVDHRVVHDPDDRRTIGRFREYHLQEP